jgi:hypothetical protein
MKIKTINIENKKTIRIPCFNILVNMNLLTKNKVSLPDDSKLFTKNFVLFKEERPTSIIFR